MKYGEIYQLGDHKLMCGDATKLEDIARLVDGEHVDLILTDPPYGMKCQRYDGTVARFSQTTIHTKPRAAKVFPFMINDDSQESAKKFYENVKDFDAVKIIWGGQYFANFLPVSGAWIFWDKLTGNNDFSDGELAWCSKGKRVRKYTHLWKGLCRNGNITLNLKHKVHPTQKPVELHARILEDFSKEGDTVLDCFGGSGTTLIACEITNRKCLMMEISPEYCDIIIERYRKLIPMKTIERIN